MATTFGFNTTANLGIPATLGKFTTPHQPVDLAADAFGQGTDLVNPLSQASVAAAVEDGTWRSPVLVTSPAPRQSSSPRKISAGILDTLRPMMRAVVTSGTAAGQSSRPVSGQDRRRQSAPAPVPTAGSSVTAAIWPCGPWSGRRPRRRQRRAGGQRLPCAS
jgi:cell division protein FtsI/penicillin-binding protein 2